MRFLDNTVLINFTLIDRQDVLIWFLQGKGAWCLSLSREAARSASTLGLEAMNDWGEVLGSPLAPTPSEILDARAIADRMLKPGEDPRLTHMGEAETLAIIVSRALPAIFLTDDHAAARVARSKHVDSVSTTRILAHAVAADQIEQTESKRCLADLLNSGRVMGNPPRPAAFDEFVQTLRNRMSPRPSETSPPVTPRRSPGTESRTK